MTPGPTTPTYAYKWTIRRNNAVVLKEGTLDLSSGKATIEIVADQPGMIYVAVEAYADVTPASAAPAGEGPRFVGGNTGRNTGFYAVGAAVAPTKIGLSTPRPADFDAFWDAKLAAQATLSDQRGADAGRDRRAGRRAEHVRARCARIEGARLRREAGQGRASFRRSSSCSTRASTRLNARAVARRAAEGWLILNVDSHDKLPSDPSGNVPRRYQTVGNTDRETSYFLNMYLRDSRALDYLLTRPDWDGKTIVLTGGSMGGQQSLALAGPAAGEDQRRARLRAGRRGHQRRPATAARPAIRTGRRTIPT